jgi:Zn-dependent protease/CBS domain-containing protein
VFGIPVRLHFTFLLLLAFLLFVGLSGRQSAAMNVVYVLALFGSVILHELGHALVAKRYGVRTIEIVMFPIGGVARLSRALGAREELWIALAGPAVNLVIAAVIFGYLASENAIVGLKALAQTLDGTMLERIGLGNLILALFNMLPAYPMDGGRVLRSLLARFRPEEDATRIAARAGRVLAIAMGFYGLLAMNFMLVFIGFFIYLGASQESAAATGRALTQGIPVRAAMVTDFRTLMHGETVRDAANLLIATSQQDFPVVYGRQVLGLLGRAGLLRAMISHGPETFVAEVMNRDFVQVAPDDALIEALPKLSGPGSCALVMDGEELVGLLTSENVSEFLLLRRVGLQVAPAAS